MALYRTAGKLSTVMGQAKYHAAAEGGGIILEIPACAVTADELKQELQRRLQTSQYTIQLKRDRYSVTLPLHGKQDVLNTL
ncbi:hypothetical protein GE21DRAFT_2951 [Neurospora crassa]|uniref:Uncharacterized protein n=2 Tax=Neurospora crassa TaxID=5141 RepID=F5HCU3_NEUCR|nr:hypothetical protein NCU05351 [Neurospora crassa OR74A]EAA34106.2 hypothetical protein NCU05351 [Neurospora crassa OR74A]KHE80053.1 hypothetical protein GE21DRAFT_2951 [Neurospora crassa]CAD01108.1 conserved hypothetical protein [Neurospora crassa]|eukprot:XP_963342.2 hypothetical protein NCU05351 [Neurospora crassa OR74A]